MSKLALFSVAGLDVLVSTTCKKSKHSLKRTCTLTVLYFIDVIMLLQRMRKGRKEIMA